MDTEDFQTQNNLKDVNDNNKTEQMKDIFHVTKLGFLIPVQTLVESHGIDILLKYDKQGYTPIHWAALGGHVHLFNYFTQIKLSLDLQSKNTLGCQPIHWACVHGHVQIVKILIQNGVSIDAIDNKGCSPLIIASQYGQTMLVAFLIGKKANINAIDKEGDNALHWAAFKGHCELTRLLIYSGLNPKVKDNFGQYPLHLACLSGDLLTVQLLCEQDEVRIDLADHRGNTPLKLAKGRKYKSLVEYLQQQQDKNVMSACNVKTILFGPPGKTKQALMFHLFMVYLYGYPSFFFKVLPYTLDFQVSHFIFILNAIVMVYCLCKVSKNDPGYLPKNNDEYDKVLKQVALYADGKNENESPLSRLCHTCRLIKPFRSKHCRISNRCIKHFDHYCPYIYNAVGYKTRHYFLMFVLCITFNAFYGLFFSYYINKYFHVDYLLVFGGLVLCVFSLTNLALALAMIHSAVTNITTNERINKKRYLYMKDGNGKFYNPFDQGYKINLLEFFHLKEPLKLERDPSSLYDNNLCIV